jgi:hypothetical protein
MTIQQTKHELFYAKLNNIILNITIHYIQMDIDSTVVEKTHGFTLV